MGPSASTGKKVKPATITTIAVSSPPNSGVSVGNVPAVAGVTCLRTSEPEIASIGMIKKNRPTSIVMPIVVLYQLVFVVMPPKAEPLLPADDANEYTTSDRPCGPELKIE